MYYSTCLLSFSYLKDSLPCYKNSLISGKINNEKINDEMITNENAYEKNDAKFILKDFKQECQSPHVYIG